MQYTNETTNSNEDKRNYSTKLLATRCVYKCGMLPEADYFIQGGAPLPNNVPRQDQSKKTQKTTRNIINISTLPACPSQFPLYCHSQYPYRPFASFNATPTRHMLAHLSAAYSIAASSALAFPVPLLGTPSPLQTLAAVW